MKSEIVETVMTESLADLRAARDRSRAGLIELRLDALARPDVAGALEGRRTPVIVTCRPAWEGGRFTGSEEDRFRILREAVELGAEFVDVEWRADRRQFTTGDRTALVLSHHDFAGMPRDLEDRVRAMQSEQPDIVKVAVTPARVSDCLVLKQAMRGPGRQVAIGMGTAGWITRVCPWLFGSCWTYGGSAAPGQVSVSDLIDMYRVSERSDATTVYAVVGAPIAHSASPAMHNAALAEIGRDAVYVPIETADADEFLAVARAVGLAGASVTAPLKTALFMRMAVADELSTRISAVNTLGRREDGWEGRNYDVIGFLAPFVKRGLSLRGKRAVVLGAGGAARTAVWALGSEGAQVEVSARRSDRARQLAAEFGAEAVAWPPAPGWDVLVNATPVGTWPAVDASPLGREYVRGACVYDLVYNPAQTALLRWAGEAGAEVIGGLEMLVGQAGHQFAWWTGREPSAVTMERAARAFIARATT